MPAPLGGSAVAEDRLGRCAVVEAVAADGDGRRSRRRAGARLVEEDHLSS